MLLQDLERKKLIHPPPWLSDNCHFLCIMGSMAYGVNLDTSDMDLYGFCIPRKDIIFPYLANKLLGFDKNLGTFDQWQEHAIYDADALAGKGRSYDIQIFNIVKYFRLLLDCNPNMIDSVFVPTNCILHMTRIGQMVRDKRKLFLHKGAYQKFKGYAYSQLHKMDSKNPEAGGKRMALREQYGFDVKYGYNLVRLISEVEMILVEGDLDLQRNNEQLKAIRRGEWTQDQIKDYFTAKEKQLEELYVKSTIQSVPDEVAVKQLLLHCLEEHFGSLANCIESPDKYKNAVYQIGEIIRNCQSV